MYQLPVEGVSQESAAPSKQTSGSRMLQEDVEADEMILALRSSIAGLCKLSGIDAPLEAQIEHIAIGAFDNIKSIDGSMITRDKFVHHCITTPEVVSWIEYYADLDDGADEPSRPGVDKQPRPSG